MEKVTAFEDSLFYDVSAWTLPLAFGVDYLEVKQRPDAFLGAKINDLNIDGGKLIGGKASSAYLMPWDRYYNPKKSLSHLKCRYFTQTYHRAFYCNSEWRRIKI